MRRVIVVVCVGAGCGSGSGASQQPQGDAAAGIDAVEAAPDAAIGEVTVIVGEGSGRYEDVPIVFHRADGSVLAERATDADGVARGPVEVDGMVTVVGGWFDGMMTVMGVQPGEEINLIKPVYTELPVANTRVSFDAFDGATSYHFTCGRSGTTASDASQPVNVPLLPECLDEAGRVDILGIALDGNALLAYCDVLDVASDAGDATMSAWTTDLARVPIAITSAGSDSSDGWEVDIASAREGRPYTGRVVEGRFDAGSAMLQFRYPRDFTTQLRVRVQMHTGLDNFSERWDWIDAVDGVPIAVDRSDLLYTVEDATVDLGEPCRPVVRWTLPAGPQPDARILISPWRMIVPPDATEVRTPELPDSLASCPDGGFPPDVHSVEADFIDDFADFRREHIGYLHLYLQRPIVMWDRLGPFRWLYE